VQEHFLLKLCLTARKALFSLWPSAAMTYSQSVRADDGGQNFDDFGEVPGFEIHDLESLDYSYRIMVADLRPDLFPTEEAIANVLKTMSYEDPSFTSIPLHKFFDLSFIQELKSESR